MHYTDTDLETMVKLSKDDSTLFVGSEIRCLISDLWEVRAERESWEILAHRSRDRAEQAERALKLIRELPEKWRNDGSYMCHSCSSDTYARENCADDLETYTKAKGRV
jgi:hypothetical protein